MLGALAALGQHSIGKAEKAVLPDGLELVVVCAHHIGLYGKFRRRGHKDDLHRRVVPADLPGGVDAVDAGHKHIQKQHVKAYPGLDICQKLHGLCIGGQLQLHPPQGAVLLQKILQWALYRGPAPAAPPAGCGTAPENPASDAAARHRHHRKRSGSWQRNPFRTKNLPLNDTTSAPFRHVFFANLQAFYIPGGCTAFPFGRVFNGGAAPLCRTSKNRAEACILPAERVQ